MLKSINPEWRPNGLHSGKGFRLKYITDITGDFSFGKLERYSRYSIREKAVAEVKKATHGFGAMVVINLVGTDATLAMAAQMVRKRGQIVVVGLEGGVLPFHYGSLPC
jgi:threonine dehydrogenase-like Zn-dependent dehydrogenase